MVRKKNLNRKKLSAIFASLAILIMGTASLAQSMSFDYYTVIGTLKKILPASFVMGALGWLIGMILDSPRSRRLGSTRNNSYLSNIIQNDLTLKEREPEPQNENESEPVAE